VTLLIVALLAGIFFGLYYKFLILIPVTLATAIASSASALWDGHSAWSALFSIALSAAGLQGGYMIGLTGRDLFGQVMPRNDGVQSKRI
jgi:cytochrome c biogenesis protein CcdA